MESDSIKELRKNGIRKLMTEASSSRGALNSGVKKNAKRPWIKNDAFYCLVRFSAVAIRDKEMNDTLI